MKLSLLKLGHCDVDKGVVLTPGSGVGERLIIPIVGYLIETDDGQHILVDSGMHRRHIEDPESTFGDTPFAAFLTPIMTPEDDIAHPLGEVGLTPDDIDILVSTHFHFDHAGNHGDFGKARIVSQRTAYDFAKANPEICPPFSWDLPNLNYEFVDGDVELVPGVELIETSGHVPGHTSILLRLPETGNLILTIDAVYVQENLDTDNFECQRDPATGRASAQKLVALAAREHATMIYGHDPAQWAGLRMAPGYYA